MTIGEFKAWFDGWTEGNSDRVWMEDDIERIKEKLAEVVDFTYTSTPITITPIPTISIPTIFFPACPAPNTGGTISCDPSWDLGTPWAWPAAD